MAKQLYFKKYERGTRLQTVDTIYSGGVMYTNTPLAENYSKLLVNYDMTKDNTLRTRPGLVRIKSYNHNESFDAQRIINAAPITTFDTGLTYQHVITGKASTTDTAIPNTGLCRSKLYFLSVDEDTLNNNAIETYKTYSTCKVYNTPAIHGLDVVEPEVRHIGCRAFNDSYFYFRYIAATNFTALLKAGYNLTAYDQATNKATYSFGCEEVSAKVCKISEAVANGFNMLSNTPYTFSTTYVFEGAVNEATVAGVLVYKDEDCTQLELTPQRGQTVYLKVVCADVPTTSVYQEGTWAGSDYLKFSVQIDLSYSLNNGQNWTDVCSVTAAARHINYGDLEKKCIIPYIVNTEGPMLVRVQLKLEGTENTNVPVSVSTALVTSFNFSYKKDTEAINYDLQNYTLHHAEGMTYWKERLILWGVPEDKSILFVSETRDPSYFPYPNNVNLFDEPIVNVVPLLDNLIVFTTSKVYVLTIDTDYIHLTQTCIQNNLRINPYDVHLMQVVKNMIFFKSGNYYYMIVPKANSLTGELTIAPVSKNIEYFLDNFKEELYKILSIVYNYSSGDCEQLKLVHYYNYLDFEDVTNVYVFKTPDGIYLNFCLLYNTIQRNWRVYMYETHSIMQPVTHDATEKSTYGILTDSRYELYKFDNSVAKDTMGTIFKNYQLYDTGYRDQEFNLKKRYRELQFIIYNRSKCNLNFGTGFFIDGNTRDPLYQSEFVIKALSDNLYNPSYTGTEQHVELTLEHSFDNVINIPGTTTLGAWVLNQSMFPEQSVYKIRFPVSGKGYSPRVLLVNKDELQYELLNTSYIYRSLYSR